MKRPCTLLIISAVTGFLFSGAVKAAKLAIHGSTTVYANVFKTKQSKIETRSDIKLKVIANGTGRGILDLINGKADMAMISSSLDTAVAKINKKYPGSIADGVLTGHKVGETKIAFIVHKSNPLQKLTLQQVRDILKGKIRNWSQVGGRNQSILVISEGATGGIRALVEKRLLGGEEISAPKRREVLYGQQVSKLTRQIPFAFGVSTLTSVTRGIKTLQTDEPISQPLILVTKGSVNEVMQKVIAAVKEVYAN